MNGLNFYTITGNTKMKQILLWILILQAFYSSGQKDSVLHLNQIQIIASHNSYKKYPPAKVIRYLNRIKKLLGKDLDPSGINYAHLPFDAQFSDWNIRGLEIDIYYDPIGGEYYKRALNGLAGLKKKSKVEELKKPGFKVLHIKDVDYETHYFTFKQALEAVKKWSDAHPNHLPIFINIESKEEGPGNRSGFLRMLGFKRSREFDATACDSIDSEIKSVFGKDLKGVITPDWVRGKHATLNEMATSNDWPLLEECRGKVVFIMEGGAVDDYIQNHPSLKGRVMFIYASPDTPECAFTKQNDPLPPSNTQRIKELALKGYIIRTRADSETEEARKGNYDRLNACLESGGHIISTDYYVPNVQLGPYHVHFPNHEIGRVNPVNGGIDGGSGLKE